MRVELIHPYTFERVPVRKPWAGKGIQRVFPSIAAELPEQSGESTEVSDVPELATRIANGPARGRTLRELHADLGNDDFREQILGVDDREFALMLKLLDTGAPLSVQVHPGDEFEGNKRVGFGKAESWLVLHAEPGAVVYQGKRQEVTPDDFWRELIGGDPASVLEAVPLQRGDFLDNPPGIVHALGPGLVLMEVQQSCNTTYRIRDWPGTAAAEERRDMHIVHAQRVARVNMPAMRKLNAMDAHAMESRATGRRNTAVALREDAPYRCYSLMLEEPLRLRQELKRVARLLSCLDGRATLRCRTPGGEATLSIEAGDTALLPAGLRDIDVFPEASAWLLETTPV